jgi:hypothetical protein
MTIPVLRWLNDRKLHVNRVLRRGRERDCIPLSALSAHHHNSVSTRRSAGFMPEIGITLAGTGIGNAPSGDGISR